MQIIAILESKPNCLLKQVIVIFNSRAGSHHKCGVQLFVKKPETTKVQGYAEERNYMSNSGIFVFRISVGLIVLKELRLDIETA